MTRLNHTVDQFTPAADRYTKFDGLERLNVVVTVPDWHEPFPIKVRMGAANPRQLEMVGLLHVCKAWYINGPVDDQWTISTLQGAINVPAGTRIESEELPEKWAGWEKEAGVEHNVQKKWFAYSNGRTAFC